MDVSYLLIFTPDNSVDYSYHLECVTDRERFFVPFQAFGAAGITDSHSGLLDFPNDILLGDNPVGEVDSVEFVTMPANVTILPLGVQNINNRPKIPLSYETMLAADVGEDLYRFPIRAQSIVSKVIVVT